MPTSRLLQRIPALIAGISTQAEGIRFPESLEDAGNVVFSLTDGARRRAGSQGLWAFKGGLTEYQYKLHRIERDDAEEYVVVYGRSVFKVFDVRNQIDCAIQFEPDALLYLNANAPRAEELRFVTIADTTVIANTTVPTRTVPGTYGAAIDAKRMPVQMQRISLDPPAFKVSLIPWKERSYDVQVIVPDGTATLPTYFRLAYKGQNTFEANQVAVPTGAGSLTDIPIDAKASDTNAQSITLRGGIEQYLAGNGKSPADYNNENNDEQARWKALTGLDAFPLGKVIVTGGPLSQRKKVYIKLSPDIAADSMISIVGTNMRIDRGDDDKNPPPSIVKDGMPITELAYHRNRLIIASGERICMSQSDDIFNFYAEEEEGLSDADPIDVELAANDVCVVEHILPYRNTMLIMTKAGQQFELQTADVLGPNSINITPTTRYPAQAVRPIQQGDRVYFAGAGDRNSIVYEYFYADTTASSVAANVTKHVETLLPSKALTLTGSANTDQMFVVAVPNDPGEIVMSTTQGQSLNAGSNTSWSTGNEPNPQDDVIIVEGDEIIVGDGTFFDPGTGGPPSTGGGGPSTGGGGGGGAPCYGSGCGPDDPEPPPPPPPAPPSCFCFNQPNDAPNTTVVPAEGGVGYEWCFYTVLEEPGLPDGEYPNSCCVTLRVSDGDSTDIPPDWITTDPATGTQLCADPPGGPNNQCILFDVQPNFGIKPRTAFIQAYGATTCTHWIMQDGVVGTEENGLTADGTIYCYRQYTRGTERKQSAWSRWTFGSDQIMDALTIDDELFALRRQTRQTEDSEFENWLTLEKIDVSDAVTPTPGFGWRLHLDHLVLGITGTYDEALNVTRWDLEDFMAGWRDPSVDTVVIRTATGTDERRGAAVQVDDEGRYVTVQGNVADSITAIGRAFVSSVTLSPVYYRAEQPIDDGRTTIMKIIVGHTNAGAYRVAVVRRDNQPTRYTSYSSRSVYTSGTLQAWVMGRNKDVRLRLETIDTRPSAWTSVEFHGIFGSHNAG